MKYRKQPTGRGELPPSIPFSDDISVLGTELDLGVLKAPNRIVYQPMEGCDGTADGAPGELTRRRYLRFAAGGPGVIWFEATAVLREGRANPRQLYLTPSTEGELARLVSEIKEACLKKNGYTPIVICQLTHSGRYSKPDGTPAPLIAYNNPIFDKTAPIDPSRIMTDDDLDRVGDALVNGARLAERVGFDGADIKASHRYLLSELLSAYVRPGKYGGSFENRTRLLTESFAAARENCGQSFIITSRINAYDGFPYPYGFGNASDSGTNPDMTEAIMLVKRLYELGGRMVNITMGNPYVNSGVNRPSASYDEYDPMESVVRMLEGTAVVAHAVPGVAIVSSAMTYLGETAPGVAAGCIKAGDFTAVGFGRLTLAYPDAAKDIISGTFDYSKLCITCGKCTELMRSGRTPGCIVRDAETYMPLYRDMQQSKAARA